MSLKEKLRADATVALKAGDELKLSTLRSVVGAIEKEEKGGKVAVVFDDQTILKIIKTQIKQRKESSEKYIEGNRPDRADRELAEAAVLETYLPTALTDDELQTLVIAVVRRFNEPTAADFGLVMKSVVPEVAGRADGKRVSEVVRSILG